MIKCISLADIISLVNGLFGFSAILMIYHQQMQYAFSFILFALLADGLDGIIARKTRKSELGEFLEAMADMISMGVAPALFVYSRYFSSIAHDPISYLLILGVLIIFLTFGIIRLAGFHIIKKETYFVGLPASAGTIIILVLSFLSIEFFFLLAVIFFVSIGMISPICFPKIDIKINMLAAVLILAAAILGSFYNNIAPIILCIAIVLYVVLGPFYVNAKKSELKATKS